MDADGRVPARQHLSRAHRRHAHAQRLPQPVTERARAQAVLRRTSSAADLAEQIVTFCRADSVTGQVVVIDGGAFFH